VERLEAFRARRWLHLDLDARDLLDERTASTVESGLPGTCLYDVILVDDQGKRLAQRLLQRTLQFDLWENRYRMQTPDAAVSFATLAQADSAWSHVRAARIFPIAQMPVERRYRLRVQVTVQPLGAEEQARISRYVSQNSRGDRQEFSLDVGGLFRRLVGKTEEGTRKTHFEGRWFHIGDLEEKP
jgi:hypothetical protein